MGKIKIYNDVYSNSTAVSNCFIDDYMKDANDAQLKVYLYLLRVLGSGMTTSVSDIADKFNHTEKDVVRALMYWEKQNLLSLDYDSEHNLNGIHLFEMNSVQPAQKANPAPVVSISSHAQAPVSVAEALCDEELSVSPDPFEKPNYTLDQLKAFKSQSEASQLLFVCEQYLGKTLSANEIRTIFFMHDKLAFSEDLIDYLMQYCVERGKKDFRYIEKVAIGWAREGVKTPADAENVSYKYDRSVYDIMNALGKNTSPTKREVDFINRWTKEYAFTSDIILEACGRAVLATDKHRFEYTEGILAKWKKEHIYHLADIEKLDTAHQQKRNAATPKQPVRNQFNAFPQNQYDFEALEQEILSN